MQSEKLNSATRFCKVCFKETSKNDTVSLFIDLPICPVCFHEMSPKIIVSWINDIKVTSLFMYNEKVKTMLYQCKGCFDFEMAGLFLVRHKKHLKKKYKDWVLVPAPSYSEKNKARGFNHVEEIFRGIGKGFLFPIEKTDNVKQADLNYSERQNIGSHLRWNEEVSVKGLKVLFVDDLFTTGATAKACTEMLRDHGANRIEVLVMARTAAPKRKSSFLAKIRKKLQQIALVFKKKRQ